MNENLPSMLPDSMLFSVNDPVELRSNIETIPELVADDHEDLYSGSFSDLSPLEKIRSILKTTQGNISQCEEMIIQIVSIDKDLKDKCETIAVTNLLPQNSSLVVDGNYEVISLGVDILVKYGINLLKPKKNPNWRSIKLSNGVFKTKVQPLKGYEDVLRELGYTEQNKASFDFLTYLKQPDLEKVAVVTADLLILQRELSQFCNNIHINRERFLKYFSSSQVRNLKGGLHSTAKEGITPQQHNNQHEKVPLKDCAMCEAKPGIIHCDKCQSAWCEACDHHWHSYPKKKSHQRTVLIVKLVKKSDVKEETVLEEPQEKCFICCKRATVYCVSCQNFFCPCCEETYHHSGEYQNHRRIKISGKNENQQDASLLNLEKSRKSSNQQATVGVQTLCQEMEESKGPTESVLPSQIPGNQGFQDPFLLIAILMFALILRSVLVSYFVGY